MADELTEAVLSEASPAELERCALPQSTIGLCVRREDEQIFDGCDDTEIDIRKSLHVEEVAIPPIASDEVLVAIMASAINYNTVWSASFRPLSTFGFLDRLGQEEPTGARHQLNRHILGSDGSGVVVQAGADVRHWKVGDHVVIQPLRSDTQDPLSQLDGMLPTSQRAWGFETNFGGLAHYSIVKATQLLPKPTHLSWEEAACNALCLTTAYRMLIGPNGARIKLGDLILIWGATGGLGAYATQLARAAGCMVVGVVSSSPKRQLAEELGCNLVLNREEAIAVATDGLRSADAWRWLGSKIRAHFGSDPDHVFEHVGRETFNASVFLARRGGIIVTCGSSTGYRHEYDNRYLWMKLKRIIGSHGGNYYEAASAIQLLRRGVIFPALSDVYSLTDAAEATYVVQKNRHVGKIGVLCMAPRGGMGITDPALREKVPADKLFLFRLFVERSGKI